MNSREKLILANEYVLSLAKGHHPITKEPLSEDSVINDVEIVRSLYFIYEAISDSLKEVSANSCTNKHKRKKPFYLSRNSLSQFKISECDITISNIVRKLHDLRNEDEMVKLTTKTITHWLVEHGFLTEITENGKTVKYPTEIGRSLGMSVKKMFTEHGIFNAVVYNSAAQEFLINNLESILKQSEN